MKFLKWTNTEKGCLAILLSFLTSNFANAAFLVEPKYQIHNGQLKVAQTKTSYNAEGGALNLGYMGDYFLAGVSLEKSRFVFVDPFATQTGKIYDGGGVGTFIGFHLWDRIKIETTYLNSTLEPNSNSDVRYFGQYFAFGISLRLWRGLMLNMQHYENQFTQFEDDTTGKTQGLDSHIKTSGNIVGLSYFIAIK